MTAPCPPGAALPPADSDPARTFMHAEAAEAGDAVRRFLSRNQATLAELGARLRTLAPAMVVTCARGSSDHAATYAKYMFETACRVPTVSAAFSTVSLYDPPVPAQDGPATLCLAISQSGRSPDLLATVAQQRQAGALVVALVNDEASPLAALADAVLPLCAGVETSVAATKSYIASLAGIAALTAAWSRDTALAAAIEALPAQIETAFALDWSAILPDLTAATNLFVIARGHGLAIAQEAALKLKETSALHGEAFSAAEVRHGPMAVVRSGFPVLGFAGSDLAGDDVRTICAEFAGRGAHVWLADARADIPPGVHALPALTARPELEPLLMIASFYRMANALSLARGHDPDRPPYLAKVTRTR